METDTKAYTTIAQNTSSTKPVQTVPAYFTGSEAAIKKYILTYHKKINYAISNAFRTASESIPQKLTV